MIYSTGAISLSQADEIGYETKEKESINKTLALSGSLFIDTFFSVNGSEIELCMKNLCLYRPVNIATYCIHYLYVVYAKYIMYHIFC